MRQNLALALIQLVSSVALSQSVRDTIIIYEPCPGGISRWGNWRNEPYTSVGGFVVPDSSNLSQSPRVLPNQMSVPYPSLALRAGLPGKAYVKAFIDSAGYPHDVGILKSDADIFDSVATATVQHWRFTPASRQGRSVGTTIVVPISFQIQRTSWFVRKPSLNVSEISLRHIPGLISGPTYEIVLRKDGTATYIGQTDVPKIGIYSGQCPKYYYRKIEALLGWYCFFDSSYRQSTVLDAADDIVSAVQDGRMVAYAESDTDFDERIWAIARLLDYIATEIKWKKTGDLPTNK